MHWWLCVVPSCVASCVLSPSGQGQGLILFTFFSWWDSIWGHASALDFSPKHWMSNWNGWFPTVWRESVPAGSLRAWEICVLFMWLCEATSWAWPKHPAWIKGLIPIHSCHSCVEKNGGVKQLFCGDIRGIFLRNEPVDSPWSSSGSRMQFCHGCAWSRWLSEKRTMVDT